MPITKTNPPAPSQYHPIKDLGTSQGFRMGIDLRFLSFDKSPLYPHLCPKCPRKLLESLSPPQFVCLLLYKLRLKENTNQQR